MNATERLKGMVNKPYLYNNNEVVILGYCDGVGDNADEVEIYLNTGATLICTRGELIMRIERFKPITKSVIVLANERLNAVSVVNPTILLDVRDTILAQIKAIRAHPEAIAQAKEVFNGVNTLVNLARTELEYRKYIDKRVLPTD